MDCIAIMLGVFRVSVQDEDAEVLTPGGSALKVRLPLMAMVANPRILAQLRVCRSARPISAIGIAAIEFSNRISPASGCARFRTSSSVCST